MCLILVGWRVHPDYPLVVAANRDEFFARRTAAADFWPGGEILAGRDLKAGGTWLGVTRAGRFAVLTNYRDPAQQRLDAASRGRLVADFLESAEPAEAWLDALAPAAAGYNGFNLIVSDGGTPCWYSNVSHERRGLEPGVYGVSNHLLDTPWPKLVAGKSALARALEALPDERPLFALLRDDSIHPDEALPRTGVSLDWERLLSSAFVRAPGYGTRSSTVLLIGRDGTTVFDEQTWLDGGRPGPRARFRFSSGYSSISTGV